jgi:hypothetical protein
MANEKIQQTKDKIMQEKITVHFVNETAKWKTNILPWKKLKENSSLSIQKSMRSKTIKTAHSKI